MYGETYVGSLPSYKIKCLMNSSVYIQQAGHGVRVGQGGTAVAFDFKTGVKIGVAERQSVADRLSELKLH